MSVRKTSEESRSCAFGSWCRSHIGCVAGAASPFPLHGPVRRRKPCDGCNILSTVFGAPRVWCESHPHICTRGAVQSGSVCGWPARLLWLPREFSVCMISSSARDMRARRRLGGGGAHAYPFSYYSITDTRYGRCSTAMPHRCCVWLSS